MSRLSRTLFAALAALSITIPAVLIPASTAQALNGVCGFYNESRAVNSLCTTNSVRSWVSENGRYHFGPYVSLGQTSWQNQNFPTIDWATYQVLLNF